MLNNCAVTRLASELVPLSAPHLRKQMEDIIGFDALYESMEKCKNGVIWKDSVAHFYLNGLAEVLKLEKELKDGTFKSRPGRRFTLTSPKRRDAMSISFRDRVVQRSLNDNAIYPQLTKHFIYDNAACQRGRGTDFARGRLKCFLQKIFRKHGCKMYVLQCDVSGYYRNMSHAAVEKVFRQYVQPEAAELAIQILNEQYGDGNGYFPGSQMVQLAGISILNSMDHYIKERLHIKYYLRYMDDFLLFHEDKEHLEYCCAQLNKGLRAINFELHPKKTRIFPITERFKFLGFYYQLTETGKIVMLIDPKNVKAERKKLRRMVALAKKGVMTREKVDECYASWRNHASKGNSHNLLQRMDRYYQDLWL